jgi:excisionase family DNA binding protein
MLRNLDNFFKKMIKEDYVSGRQLAKILGISQTTLIRLRNAGKAPAYVVVGKRAKYPRDAVLHWLKEHVCVDVPRASGGAKQADCLHTL